MMLKVYGSRIDDDMQLALNSKTQKVCPFWKSCTSLDHVHPALRADLQQYLKVARDELGSRFSRIDEHIG